MMVKAAYQKQRPLRVGSRHASTAEAILPQLEETVKKAIVLTEAGSPASQPVKKAPSKTSSGSTWEFQESRQWHPGKAEIHPVCHQPNEISAETARRPRHHHRAGKTSPNRQRSGRLDPSLHLPMSRSR